MSKKILGRASLAVIAGLAAFSLTACDWGSGGRRDEGIGQHEPPRHWPDHGHDSDRGRGNDHGHDNDRGRGNDHGRDNGRGHEGDHGRGRDHERRDTAAVTADARNLKALATVDDAAAGKMFDGRK